MERKNEEELKEKCTCACNEDCTCGENCECGDDCTCGDDCECDCACNSQLPPLEEKFVLIGIKDEKETKKAMKYLDSREIDYEFIDLDEGKKEGFLNLDDKIEVPTLLLVQTVISGAAFGLDEIKKHLKKSNLLFSYKKRNNSKNNNGDINA